MSLLLSMAAHGQLKPEHFEKLKTAKWNSEIGEDARHLASKHALDAEQTKALSGEGASPRIREAVAENHSIPFSHKVHLMDDPTTMVKKALIDAPDISSHQYNHLYSSLIDTEEGANALYRSDKDYRVSPENIKKTLASPNVTSATKAGFLSHPNIPTDVLHDRATNGDHFEKVYAAKNPKLHPDVLHELSKSPDSDLLAAVAKNSSTRPETLNGIDHSNRYVAINLASNKNTPESKKVLLRQHPDRLVTSMPGLK